ncbi:MAG: hypothetical protein ACI9T9_001737 [Oleiphilaceae bacterium]
MELFAIDANATVPWNWAIATTSVDLIATLDYLVRSTPAYIIYNMVITTAPPNAGDVPAFKFLQEL